MIQTIVQDLEDQLISLLTVFPHQRFRILHCRRFQWFKTIGFKNGTDGLQDEISFAQNGCWEVPCALWDRWLHVVKLRLFGGLLRGDQRITGTVDEAIHLMKGCY